MSDLKHKSAAELSGIIKHEKQMIGKLRGQINNRQTRLEWAERYYQEKTQTVASVCEKYQKLQDECCVDTVSIKEILGDLKVLLKKEVSAE